MGGKQMRLLVILGLLLGCSVASAANFPLELVSPRQAGTTPAVGFPTMPTGHRIFKAYPGLVYNIRPVVFGGAYPYTFALSNEPSGMTIDENTGEINWPNPTGTTETPTVTVTDAESTQRSEAWTITITTSGFKFVDAVGGSPSGDGSIGNPWQDLDDVHGASAPGEILYLRGGTYSNDNISRAGVGSVWERITFNSSSHPMIWLEYPGETAKYDAGYVSLATEVGALIRLDTDPNNPIYVDGFEIFNFRNIALQIITGEADYNAFRNVSMHDMMNAEGGQNPGGIMFTSAYASPGVYCAVQDSEFYNLNGNNGGGGLKIYSNQKMVVEDNIFRDSVKGFDPKAHVPQFDIRNNRFTNISDRAIYGNMVDNGSGVKTSGEIRFNLVNTPAADGAFDFNQNGEAGVIYAYRNTFIGPVRARLVDSADGPFYLDNNVIVNDDDGVPSGSHVRHITVTDPTRIVLNDNLAGYPADGIVDANGDLTPAYSSYLGTHGYQISESMQPPTPSPAVFLIN